MKQLAVALFAMLCWHSSFADNKIIRLNDGSEIQADVVSLVGGIYTVRSRSLGTLKLRASEIISIQDVNLGSQVPDAGSAQPEAGLGAASAAVEQLSARMMSDTSILTTILSLQNDPDMQAILNDPEIMRAVQSFDLDALSNNPKIKRLMNSVKIREIQKRIN